MRRTARSLVYLAVCCSFLGCTTTCFADGVSPVQVSIYPPLQLVPKSWSIYGIRLSPILGKNRDVYGLDLGLINRTERHQGGLQLGLFGNIVATSDEFAFFDRNSFKLGNMPDKGDRIPESSVTGVQLALAGNMAGHMRWIQVGSMNKAIDMVGIQLAPNPLFSLNDSYGHASGLQLSAGFMAAGNTARDMRGIQVSIGFIGLNMAAKMKGVQIGLGVVAGNGASESMSGIQIGNINANDIDMSGLQIGIFNSVLDTMSGVQIGAINYARNLHGVQVGLINIVRESPVPFLPILNAHF